MYSLTPGLLCLPAAHLLMRTHGAGNWIFFKPEKEDCLFGRQVLTFSPGSTVLLGFFPPQLRGSAPHRGSASPGHLRSRCCTFVQGQQGFPLLKEVDICPIVPAQLENKKQVVSADRFISGNKPGEYDLINQRIQATFSTSRPSLQNGACPHAVLRHGLCNGMLQGKKRWM
jgi:hypothetical protein